MSTSTQSIEHIRELMVHHQRLFKSEQNILQKNRYKKEFESYQAQYFNALSENITCSTSNNNNNYETITNYSTTGYHAPPSYCSGTPSIIGLHFGSAGIITSSY